METAEATERWERFCAGGEGAAFDELYRAYRVRLVRYCRARVHDEEAAADIADQLFAYLYLKRPACTANFESLLFHYARLRCANFRPRPPTIPLADCPAPAMPMVDPADAAPDTTESAETEHSAAIIERALRELSSDERDVILLHHFAELPLSEVGRVIGLPRWKVKWRYRKGLRRLQEILRKFGF